VSRSVRIRYYDRGWLQIVKGMRDMNSMRVKAGLVGREAQRRHRNSDISMVEVGMINEFGSADGHVPERSWLRRPLRRASSFAGLRAAAVATTQAMLNGVAPSKALRHVGDWAVGSIKEAITSTLPPAQAQRTVDRKGHSKTLRHTYSFLNAISYKITTWAENIIDDDQGTKVSADHGGGDWY
jgi:hypothetical protein